MEFNRYDERDLEASERLARQSFQPEIDAAFWKGRQQELERCVAILVRMREDAAGDYAEALYDAVDAIQEGQ